MLTEEVANCGLRIMANVLWFFFKSQTLLVPLRAGWLSKSNGQTVEFVILSEGRIYVHILHKLEAGANG
jgi:hypothetical protein